VRWMRTSEAEGSLALLLLVLLMLLLLDWEKVAVLLLALVKDGCLEAGFGVMGCLDGRGEAALAVPRVGGGLWEAFLERKERRRMKRGPIEDSLRLDTGGPSLFLSIPTRCEFV